MTTLFLAQSDADAFGGLLFLIMIACWIGCGIWAAHVAESKGHGRTGFFILGLLAGLIGVLIAYLMPDKNPQQKVVHHYHPPATPPPMPSNEPLELSASMMLEPNQKITYRYECPHCNRTMSSTRNFDGRNVSCPGCKSAFRASVFDKVIS